MNENAMMKTMGRNRAKAAMTEAKMAKGGGIYTEKMGQPPVDVDGASAGMGMKRPKNMAGSKRRPTEAEKKQATKKMAVGGKAYAKGGSVSARADGCAIKGKTKGKEIKMAKGGKTC